MVPACDQKTQSAADTRFTGAVKRHFDLQASILLKVAIEFAVGAVYSLILPGVTHLPVTVGAGWGYFQHQAVAEQIAPLEVLFDPQLALHLVVRHANVKVKV